MIAHDLRLLWSLRQRSAAGCWPAQLPAVAPRPFYLFLPSQTELLMTAPLAPDVSYRSDVFARNGVLINGREQFASGLFTLAARGLISLFFWALSIDCSAETNTEDIQVLKSARRFVTIGPSRM